VRERCQLDDIGKPLQGGALTRTKEPKSCTMIITDANELAANVHDRIPVLLQPSDFDGWLAGIAGRPAPNDYLQVWTVSGRVNSSRAQGDDPTRIDRVAA
jgi:putative SOS response-associated peptidase YedK